MAHVYFVVARISSLKNSYAVKKIEVNEEIYFPHKIFDFDIEGAKLIYVGKYTKTHEMYENKINFHLIKYRTKINKNVYKLDLTTLIGRVRYGCEDIFIDGSLTKGVLTKSSNIENIRRDKLSNPKEIINNSKVQKIIEKYNNLEDEWLNLWKNIKLRLDAFYLKHPKPLKSQYYRSGLSSLIFGKFRNDDYNYDSQEHFNRLKWLCNKLADEFNQLNLYFETDCPGDCGDSTSFNLDFDYESYDSMEKLEDFFPFQVYKKLNLIKCACSECGSFQISFEDEYTSAFRNYEPEIISFIGRKIIQDHIAYSIENKLYGDLN
jgi:hypothetical protein